MFTPELMKQRIAELLDLKSRVELDSDPIAAGLPFNAQLAELTSCRDRVGALVTEALLNKQQCQDEYNMAEFNYELRRNRMMEQKDIMELKAKEIREAKVNNALEFELRTMQEKAGVLSSADSYLKVANVVDKILDAKNDNLRSQMYNVQNQFNIHPDLRETVKFKRGGTNE